jgi:crotonobetainyl-CoA:carnitine CoA-transferase CaiB-like acyl-CoA transferase
VTQAKREERALAGIRILELATGLAGPFCGQVLADLGADVLKIERLPGGDETRSDREQIAGLGASFVMTNRNKRSVALDLTRPAGREVLHRLARTADVLVESEAPGALDRLGIGHEAMAREAPRLVYCSVTGYGQHGPYARRPGHDINFAAIAGMLAPIGRRDGMPAPPTFPASELGGALFAAVSILAALRARDRTGAGQYIDLSLADAAISLLPLQYALSWAQGPGEASPPGGHPPGYGIYVTRDGEYLALGAHEDRYWRRLCELIGRPDLGERHLPRDAAERERVETALAMAIAERTREEWIELLADDEVCAAPVLTLEGAMRDPHNVHRDTFGHLSLRDGARVPQIGYPARLSETPAVIARPPPRVGEHTEEVLLELGYTRPELVRLENAGAVATARE